MQERNVAVLDVHGEIDLGTVAALREALLPVIEDQTTRAADTWQLPDQGIWEARGEPKHYTSSKLMCWVALDRGARLAARRGKIELADQWREIANEIHAEICERGIDDRGVFTQHYDTDALDASLLLMRHRFDLAGSEAILGVWSA